MSLATLPRPHLQSLLAANFGQRSLANRLQSHGYPGNACCQTETMAADALVHDPHFRRSVEWQLTLSHRDLCETVAAADLDLLRTYLLRGDYRKHPNLGGLLWALAVDSRSQVRASLGAFLERIQRDALRSLAKPQCGQS